MRPVIGLTVALALATAAVFAQSAQVDQHIAAAKTAAQDDHGALFTSLCSAEPTGPGTGRRGGTGQRQDAPPGPPARDAWHAEPMKVFDNLYFVGMKDVSAWALTTSAGIIVIDALYDYSVDDEVAEGLKNVGLDPANIKYVIVSHGHGDHSAGAKYLQDRYKARVLLSARDWDLLDRGRGAKPARDMVATDGQQLMLGDTTITMYLTPGAVPRSTFLARRKILESTPHPPSGSATSLGRLAPMPLFPITRTMTDRSRSFQRSPAAAPAPRIRTSSGPTR
jgi:metallo-beta-lactamase class B